MNASTALLRSLIARGDYLERVSVEEARRILPILEAAHDELLGRIAKAPELSRAWLEEEIAGIDEIYRAATEKAGAEIRPDLVELANDEGAWVQAEARGIAIGISLATPAPSLFSAVVDLPTTVGGSTLNGLFEALAINSRQAAYDAIAQGILEGDTVEQLARRLRGEVVKRAYWKRDPDGVRRYHPGVYQGGALEDVSTRQATQLARTAVMHVSNHARELVYKSNEDIFKGYQYVATLDPNTCLICAADDGRVFGLNEARPVLPRHIGDRCLYVPVLKSWRELGVDADELPPATRASMDGQVPEYETYADRLAKASPERRREMLGPGRARLYEAGMKFEDMVEDGRELTLKELDAKWRRRNAA